MVPSPVPSINEEKMNKQQKHESAEPAVTVDSADSRTHSVADDQNAAEKKIAAIEGDEEKNELQRVGTNTDYPTGAKLTLITIALCLSVFCMALDNTIISTAIPRITDQFKAINDVGWYGSAYLLTTCAFQLFFGKLYTFFSIKWLSSLRCGPELASFDCRTRSCWSRICRHLLWCHPNCCEYCTAPPTTNIHWAHWRHVWHCVCRRTTNGWRLHRSSELEMVLLHQSANRSRHFPLYRAVLPPNC